MHAGIPLGIQRTMKAWAYCSLFLNNLSMLFAFERYSIIHCNNDYQVLLFHGNVVSIQHSSSFQEYLDRLVITNIALILYNTEWR